jgi:putative ABC transport system ATP-binding protein
MSIDAPRAMGFGSGDLVIDDVTVEYASGDYVVRPVDAFSRTIPDGSLALLLGPSGCGKTTLLSCLAGILSPTSGTIHHGDTEITSLGASGLTAYRRHGVGIVFQAFNLVPSLTATENVMLPMRCAGTKTKAARQRAAELLDEVDLSDRADHLPSRLSGGQQQRVAIARALALDPPLILADEPTAHLDYIQVETTLRILRSLARPGRVVVVVTHDDRLLPLADEVVELVPHRRPDAVRREVELAAGEVLFCQGDPSDLVYVIEHGTISIERELPDGSVDQLSRLDAGRTFGELGPVFGLPRSATARAAQPTKVTGYPLAEYKELVGLDQLATLLSERAPSPVPSRASDASPAPIRGE